MSDESVYIALRSNSRQICDETVRTLVRIIDNIVQNPTNLKIRTLQKDNKTIHTKIIQVCGGVACLKLLGFLENETCFTLPESTKTDHFPHIKADLLELWTKYPEQEPSTTPDQLDDDHYECILPPVDTIKRFVLPPLQSQFSNVFLQRVETYFHSALSFADTECQARALALIPLKTLEIQAQHRLRRAQENIKFAKQPDPSLTIQDFVLLELLAWFKAHFFEWVDQPACAHCSSPTENSHMSTNPKELLFTKRVEVFKCTKCGQFTNFPRYNDLNLLLETRRGRCGEWAQVFTLFCLALKWDARFVVEEGDHVWTEVFSVGRGRWVHCDPCENACDSPLMYETGWRKAISYVMAYSADEVQDVTWRYTGDFGRVMASRRQCSERALLDALFRLRGERQERFSDSKRNYLTRRVINELVEMLEERKASDDEFGGRISGGELWRNARGENGGRNGMFFWAIKECDIVGGQFRVEFSASRDDYLVNGGVRRVSGWERGVLGVEDVFRKEEKDWKIVYLARNEGVGSGSIRWKFEVSGEVGQVIDRVEVELEHKTYENGVVDVEIASESLSLAYPKDGSGFDTEKFSGAKSLLIRADLHGGKGNVGWQHAQLFRQATDSRESTFKVLITLKKAPQ